MQVLLHFLNFECKRLLNTLLLHIVFLTWFKVLLFSFCRHFCSLSNNKILMCSYFKCLYLRYKSQPEVPGLCKFMFVKMWWLTVIEGYLCGAPLSVHYERFMASFALSVCFLFLAPGPVLILPWTFAAEGLQRTGGGWIWIAAQVCACCNLHHPPPPLGLCTILFESRVYQRRKILTGSLWNCTPVP